MPDDGRRGGAVQVGSYLDLQEPVPYYDALLRALQHRGWSLNRIADVAVDVREEVLVGKLPYAFRSIDIFGRHTFPSNTPKTPRILSGRTLLDIAGARRHGQTCHNFLAPRREIVRWETRRECNGTKYRHRVREDGGPFLDPRPSPGASLSLYFDGVVFARLFLKPAQTEKPAAAESRPKHRRDHPQWRDDFNNIRHSTSRRVILDLEDRDPDLGKPVGFTQEKLAEAVGADVRTIAKAQGWMRDRPLS